MPRRKLRLTPTEDEQKALDEIKRIHQAGGRKLKPAEARKLLKRAAHVRKLPGCKVRFSRDGRPQYKGLGFGQWREYSPLEYENAKAERDYLAAIEKAKVPRVRGGAEARKARGDEIRRRVLEAWRQSTLPERNRAAAIARELGISARQVRHHLRRQ